MALSPGTKLAHYEILTPLGAGGMGEVYRARDSKLHREVAIKVLPDAVAGDAERLARMEREARALASLNHPNIAQIHGLEGDGAGTPPMLVMELVQGDNLAARISSGPIAVDETLAIARQIAEGLDAAHSAGIVHRDLKPANVMVRADGVVKLLDFGLAKPGAPGAQGALGATGAQGATGAPGATGVTVTSPDVTRAGMLVGTAAYMSPEQARGRNVDKRTDIWAFGCLIFEMLTGRPAFEGDTITDILGAIVKSEPDWTTLPPATPPSVRHLLERCLQKDAAKRLRDIGDAIHDLDPATIARTRDASGAMVARPAPRISRTMMTLAVLAGGAALGAGISTALYLARPATTEPVLKFQIAVQREGGSIRQPLISPDGRQVTYAGGTRGTLWVQALDEWEPRELAGTESAVRPFWSPDGEWIAFFRSEALLKVPTAGGPVVRIATLPAVQAPLGANSGVWRRDGTLILSLAVGPLLRVASGGGDVTTFAEVPSAVARNPRHLSLLPDESLLLTVTREGGVTAIGVLDDNGLRIVLDASEVAFPRYAEPGYLVFARRAPNSGLWAVQFSVDGHETIGEPFLIGTGDEPSMAHDGTLAFLPAREDQPRQLAWFSFDGRPGATVAEPREWIEGVSISRSGTRLLASAADGVWVYDISTGARSRITRGSNDIMPQWVDDNRIVFVRTDGTNPVLVLKSLGGAGDERVLAERARFPRVTADGRRVVFNQRRESSTVPAWEVAWIDLEAPDVIHRLPDTHIGARYATVSPDGSLVAYISGEVGRDEVFLTTLPSGDGKWQLSSDGGGWTLFSPRGNEVFYRALDNSFMSVPIENGKTLKIGAAKKLFEWGSTWLPFYDIAQDGTRGIAAMPIGKSVRVPSLSVVRQWHREFLER